MHLKRIQYKESSTIFWTSAAIWSKMAAPVPETQLNQLKDTTLRNWLS
jgi:hypothetical protein